MIALHETTAGVTFAVKLSPRRKQNAISGEIGDALKISVTAPPAEGKANQACINLLASVLQIPRSFISIVSGHSSRNKVVRVSGISADEVRAKLNVGH